MCSIALFFMKIKEFQNLASLILHMIRQILKECLCKIHLRYKVLNKVLHTIFNVTSDHDFIFLSSETSDTNFAKHVLIVHKM